MNSENTIGILELGTPEIKCIIIKKNSDQDFEVLGHSKIQSKGFHNGVVVNLSEATEAIRTCISETEKKSNVDLRKIYVLLELNEFLCTRISKYKNIGGAKIENNDISYLIKEAKNQIKLNNPQHTIIHIFNFNYYVDNKYFEKIPIGIFANQLRNEISLVSCPINILKNINQTLVNCDIEPARFISESFALGVQNLSELELKLGTTVLNFGFEKTSISIFKNSALVHSASFSVGLNHITKDISRVCSLTTEESEIIKKTFQLNELKKDSNFLGENFFKNSKYRKISMELIQDIIVSRAEEIFDFIKKEIKISGLEQTSGQNLVIKYKTDEFPELKKLISKNFFCNLREIEPTDDIILDYEACYGAIQVILKGFATEAIPDQNLIIKGKLGILEKILSFGR